MAERKEDELIDLSKLTQRELLILLHQDVSELKAEVKAITAREQELALKVNSLESRSKVWGSVAGFLTALGAILFEKLIK